MTKIHAVLRAPARPCLAALMAGLGLAISSSAAHAFEQKFSGFGTLAAGSTRGACEEQSNMASAYTDFCTRYIADWAHAGVYTPEWSAKAESRVGVQWTGEYDDRLSATVQLTGRLTPGTKAGVEWAYLTWKPSKDWTLQAGRKRLPLYYYSDFQDVGYAYSMIRPQPDVYGWDAVNYTGLSADWSGDMGDWAVRASFYGGAENSRKNRYTLLVQDGSYDVKWTGIAGSAVELSRDWLTLRLSYTQSGFQQVDRSTGQAAVLANGKTTGRQRFFGVAAIMDEGDWLGRVELGSSERGDQGYDAKYWYASAGHRFGKWTPTLSVSNYKESSTIGDEYVPLVNRTYSAAVRYELNGWSALKLQFDRNVDTGIAPFAGHAQVLAIAYDFIF